MNWTIISTDEEYNRALERLEIIFDSKSTDSTFKEAELLTMLIENYELETEPAFPDADPIEVIKFKMEQHNMRNKDLAKIVGGKSKASEILNRKRKLTLKTIRQINKLLKIPAEVLIGEYELVKWKTSFNMLRKATKNDYCRLPKFDALRATAGALVCFRIFRGKSQDYFKNKHLIFAEKPAYAMSASG